MFDPYKMIMEMARNNPQMKPIIEQLQKGANTENLFRELCKQKNVNPDAFINELKSKYGNTH